MIMLEAVGSKRIPACQLTRNCRLGSPWPHRIMSMLRTVYHTKQERRPERVNDFATSCFINLLCKFVFCQGLDFPLTEG